MRYGTVEVKVGSAWVPAHPGTVSETRAAVMKLAYKSERPNRQLRFVPESPSTATA